MDNTSKTTTDHEEIRRWVEERDGTPAKIKGTEKSGKGPGMIRIDFPGWSEEESLEPIEWDEWFEVFDDKGLAFVYQEHMADGTLSRFNKIVSRKSSGEKEKDIHHQSAKRKTKEPRSTGRKNKEKKPPRKLSM